MWLLKACSLEGFILRNEHFWFSFDSVFPWLFLWDRISLCRSWNSLCRPDWPWTQNSACLFLESAGIKGTHYHCLAVPHPPFLDWFVFTFCFWMLTCVYVRSLWACQERASVPWSYRRLCTATWELRIDPLPLGEQPVLLPSESSLNPIYSYLEAI